MDAHGRWVGGRAIEVRYMRPSLDDQGFGVQTKEERIESSGSGAFLCGVLVGGVSAVLLFLLVWK